MARSSAVANVCTFAVPVNQPDSTVNKTCSGGRAGERSNVLTSILIFMVPLPDSNGALNRTFGYLLMS